MSAFGEDDRCPECGYPIWRASGCSRIGCERGRRNRERDVRTAARAREVRSPPPCPFDGVAGVCRLCGELVTGRRRTWCSQSCVDIYSYSRFPQIALSELRLFYPGCWECGAIESFDVAVEVDHVVPLWNLTEEERRELKWWLPFNLELLCTRCHRAKSKREAGRRAERRREEGLRAAMMR